MLKILRWLRRRGEEGYIYGLVGSALGLGWLAWNGVGWDTHSWVGMGIEAGILRDALLEGVQAVVSSMALALSLPFLLLWAWACSLWLALDGGASLVAAFRFALYLCLCLVLGRVQPASGADKRRRFRISNTRSLASYLRFWGFFVSSRLSADLESARKLELAAGSSLCCDPIGRSSALLQQLGPAVSGGTRIIQGFSRLCVHLPSLCWPGQDRRVKLASHLLADACLSIPLSFHYVSSAISWVHALRERTRRSRENPEASKTFRHPSRILAGVVCCLLHAEVDLGRQQLELPMPPHSRILNRRFLASPPSPALTRVLRTVRPLCPAGVAFQVSSARHLASLPSKPAPTRLRPRRPPVRSAPASAFLGFPRHCSHASFRHRRANMTDRDILPDNFKPVHYDLVIKDLDFKNWSYKGTVRCAAHHWPGTECECVCGLTAPGSMARLSSPRARLCSTPSS